MATPCAAPFPTPLSGGPLLYRAEKDGVRLEIEIAPAGERRIALLVLPVSRIRIAFLDGDRAAREKILRHMDLAMRRGGGRIPSRKSTGARARQRLDL